MNIQRYTDPSVFEQLAEPWETLIKTTQRSDLFFMTPQWQQTWWKHLGRGELNVLAICGDDGEFNGIASWLIEDTDTGQTVQTVGCIEVADYLDVIIKPGSEQESYTALLDYALSDEAPEWQAFNLCNIPESSATLSLLADLASQRGLHTQTIDEDVSPVLELPANYDDYLSQLDKKQRQELRRKRRRADALDIGWYTVGEEHDLDEEIDAFLKLMAMSTTEKSVFLQEEGNATFFREIGHVMFDAGILELVFLVINEERAATMWQFAYEDRMLLYNSGLNVADFGALSPGIVLLTHSIGDAIERGFKYYDFLQGDEEYKYRMGAQNTQVKNLVISR
ncbi:MAG: GNAT family N-acetyltransferase [Chloroflexi bacterium]|nr:GNAT family N-acetyltransferase [Chloroflexota bacterium]